MIWQLRKARKLDGVRGIVFGEMLDCVPPGAAPDLLDQAILSALDEFDGPIAIGLRSGHVSRDNVTLTFGVEAELTATDEPRLHLLEPAVASVTAQPAPHSSDRHLRHGHGLAGRPACSCRATASRVPTAPPIRR